MSIKPGLKLIFFPLFSHFCKKSKNLSAKFIRNFYPQNLSVKFIRKIYPQNLSAIFIRKIYPQNLSAKYIRNFCPQSAIRTRIFHQTFLFSVCKLFLCTNDIILIISKPRRSKTSYSTCD